MEVAVFTSGVADPKWPLPHDLSTAALQAHSAQRATLSPFDEAALEVALALRDADPGVRVTALVAGDEALARKVAGWRPDAIHRIDLGAAPRWDSIRVARALAAALEALAPKADLALVGREFGDYDDGTVPAALAQQAGRPYVALALAIARGPDGADAVRQGSGGLERLRLRPRALLSVTNDPGNRLRHPLMKNVMTARKMQLPQWQAPQGPDAASLDLGGVRAAPVVARTGACEWLEGSAQQKAQALARFLLDARRA